MFEFGSCLALWPCAWGAVVLGTSWVVLLEGRLMPRLSFPVTFMVTFRLHRDRDKVQVPGGNLMRESVGGWMQAGNC
jgi:hypothetical protein